MKLHSPRLDSSVARETARCELAALISRFAPADGAYQTAIPSLTLYRCSQPVDLGCGVTSSAFVFAAQGAKRVMVAGQAYDYDHLHCLVTSVDLPMMSQVTRASPDAPYLCVKLTLDPQRIVELATQLRLPEPDAASAGEGIAVGSLSTPVFDAALRLVRLLDTPGDIPVLAPLIEKELLYRLMTSEQGKRLRQAAVNGGEPDVPDRAGNRVDPESLHRAFADGDAGTGGEHERVVAPSSLQERHDTDSAAVSEATAATRGAQITAQA